MLEAMAFPCTFANCDKVMKTAGTLRAHIDALHRGLKKPCGINGCNRMFSDTANKNRHQRTAHKNSQRPSKCDFCDFTGRSDNVRRHQQKCPHRVQNVGLQVPTPANDASISPQQALNVGSTSITPATTQGSFNSGNSTLPTSWSGLSLPECSFAHNQSHPESSGLSFKDIEGLLFARLPTPVAADNALDATFNRNLTADGLTPTLQQQPPAGSDAGLNGLNGLNLNTDGVTPAPQQYPPVGLDAIPNDFNFVGDDTLPTTQQQTPPGFKDLFDYTYSTDDSQAQQGLSFDSFQQALQPESSELNWPFLPQMANSYGADNFQGQQAPLPIPYQQGFEHGSYNPSIPQMGYEYAADIIHAQQQRPSVEDLTFDDPILGTYTDETMY